MEGNNAFLPQEIIVNILKRLPIKSLIRFQCVCKNWKNLLKDPLFISDHLHHSIHRNSLLFHQQPDDGNKQWQFRSLDCDFRLRVVDNAPLVDYFSSFETRHVRIIGSSNGLLCVELSKYHRPYHNLLLWNPAIKDIKEVPRTIDFSGKLSIGFGFSTFANDYKIVKIYGCGTSYYDKNEGLRREYTEGVNRVEVYSLNKGSWKDVEFGTLEGLHMYSKAGIASNGAVIWVGRNENNESLILVSFDIAMEVFTLIPLPSLPPRSTAIPTMYDNKLAVLFYYDEMRTFTEFRFIHLWVTDEENNTSASRGRWTWTKKYSGGPYSDPDFFIPQNIWRNEIVCKVEVPWRTGYDARTLYLLNPTTNEFKKFVINNFSLCYSQILNYAESLVPAGNLPIQEP